MCEFKEVCERAARAGGDVLLQWRDRIQAREKAPRDLVTEADLESQRVIRDIALGAFPDHTLIGEEDVPAPRGAGKGGRPAEGPQYCWIVDPLDGTTNYVHGLQPFAVSVALAKGAEIVVGVVFDPVKDECYSACVGQGASLNGARLQTSGCSRLEDALVAASFSARVPRGSVEVARFVEVLHACRAVRRLGSAALNLCYVAAGRLDAYFASSVKMWDVAAGTLILREAGGVVTGMDAKPLDLERPQLAAAATAELHATLLQALARAAPP
jgi:myo-inositol-1(or 4)-monophosphatase